MKRIISNLFAFLAAFFTAAAIAAVCLFQGQKPMLIAAPEEAVSQVEKLMEAVCKGDFAQAETMLDGSADLGADRAPAVPAGAMIWEAYVESLDYELVGDLYTTDTGLAQNVKIISMELPSATKNLRSRTQTLLNEAVAAAEDVSELYDQNNEYREDLVMDILHMAVSQALEEDVRYIYQVVPLQLVYSDGQWKVAADRGFLNAISGGIAEYGGILDKFDMYINNVTGDALEGALSIEKVYWLHDADTVAPKPDPDQFGEAADPKALEPILKKAEKLLEDQDLIFKTDVEIRPDSKITYYLDDTILCITWQHQVGKAVYTCSEVKIAHPSQFRRFLSDGKFGSGKLYKATEMAADVNAVTASNGDYYAYRGYGNLVYNGEVKMAGNRYLDTCYVDAKGDLILKDYGPLYKKQDIEKFVAENDIRFSLAFGPILVENGKVVAKYHYAVGETEEFYSRAALCQIAPLHYMLVTVNRRGQNVTRFATHLQEMGVDKAYALDGGQTSTIVTGNKLMNPVDYGGERETSDIIYFATAIPDGG